MKKLMLKLLMGLCIAIIMVGCGQNTTSEKSKQTEEKKVEEKKTLTFALGGELDNLSSTIMNTQNPGAQKMVFENLVIYKEDEIQPCLAKSWEFNDHGTELTFHLQEGVMFHDGESFNAEAVKANLDYYRQGPNYAFLKGVSTIKAIDVLDEYTVKLTYESPYFAILNDLTSPEVMVMVSPKTIVQGNYEGLKGTIGTGPYIYDAFVKGEYTRFVRNENYWGEKSVYDEVIAKYIPDSASRVKALQTGEIDMIFGSSLISYDDYVQVTKLPEIEGQISQNNVRTRNIAVNASGKMLSNINLRKAVAHAINKEAIVQGLTYGYEETASNLFIENTPYADIELNNNWTYDIKKANDLLEDEGWIMNEAIGVREKDGVKLNLVFTYDEGVALNKEIVTAIKSQLAEVGISIESKGLEQMLWWQEDYMGNYDLTIWDTAAAPELPHLHFTPMLDSSAEMAALSKMKDVEEVNETIKAYMKTSDKEKVAESFKYLINYINDNVIDIPISYTKELIVYNKNKIGSYEFNDIVKFFDITNIKESK